MILSSFSVEGKVAIVTGATTGLGQAMSIGLAEAGADVAGVDYVDAFADTKAAVEKAGRKFAGIKADLSKMENIGRVVEEARKAFGKINILVNNAGIIRRAPCLEFSEKDWDDVMNINIKAVFFLSQAVARVFVEQGTGGKIVNIASMLSYQGGILVPSYTASKSAVAGITKTMANEWASQGICVNAIAPGYMATNNTTALRADAARNEAILARIPANRWGEPSDLAGMCVFLASPASNYCNGTVYPVDGGWLAR